MKHYPEFPRYSSITVTLLFQIKPNQNRNIGIEEGAVVLEWKRQEGEGEMGNGDLMYGDRWKLNFWW